MNFQDEPVYTHTNKIKVDAALYQAMFDEVIRLRKCSRASEREKIRGFVLAAYQLLVEYSFENTDQNTIPKDTPQ